MMSTVKKKPTQLTGIGQIIGISRQIFLPRTFSICSLVVDFQLVSHVTFEISGIRNATCQWLWWNTFKIHKCVIVPFLFMFLGNVHVYSNGRMRFGHQQRPERREQQREVRVFQVYKSFFVQIFYQQGKMPHLSTVCIYFIIITYLDLSFPFTKC